jgi:hypothetical protein
MKKYYQNLFAAACSTLAFMAFGALLTFAQTTSKPASKQLSEFFRDKRQRGSFNLLKPEDSSKNSGENLLTKAAGDPCDKARSMDVGQTTNGFFTPGDCPVGDGSYAQFFIFNGTAGQQVRLFMNSSSVDSYLGLANESGTFVIEDDDSGGGWSALITATLPETGLYVILANAVFPNVLGGYQISLTGPQPCSYTFSPATPEIPAAGGTFSFTVNTQPECYWQAVQTVSYATSTSSGRGTGTATYTVQQNGSGQTRTGSVGISTAPLITFITPFSFTQPSVACNYSLNPSSVNVPGTANSGSFQVITPAGCPWTVQNNTSIISASGSGAGSGTVNYSVEQNNGVARTATLNVGGQPFTINQAGLNCTYGITPTLINVPRQGTSGEITVNTQAGCTWFIDRNVEFITVQTGSRSGPGTIPYTVAPQPAPQPRSGAIQIFYSLNQTSQSTTVFFDQSGTFSNPEFDYDGDGKANLVVFRPSNGKWYIELGPGIYSQYAWGLPTDKLVPADYDGNGRGDLAVFRPSDGIWYIGAIGQGNSGQVRFGTAGDIPVPADYDGDGRADIAVYRPSEGIWYIQKSSDSQYIITRFGLAEDVPTRGDFDGDGRADIALWRPSTGVWYRLNSSNGAFFAYQFGLSEDKPVAADYDGDGRTDIAVWRPSDRVWYRLNSSTGAFSFVQFGLSDDLPTAADYDGDRKADISVFRPSTATWYILNSTSGGFTARQFGIAGDLPISNAFTR